MMTPDEVKAWRKVERARLIAERMALPIEQRRNARTRVRAMLAAEVRSCAMPPSASIGHSGARSTSWGSCAG